MAYPAQASGVVYFWDGEIRATYGAGAGLGEGRVADLRVDPDGTVWAATEGGLSRLKDGHAATLSSRNGLPCDAVVWVGKDDSDSFWLYTSCGLVRIEHGSIPARHSLPPQDDEQQNRDR